MWATVKGWVILHHHYWWQWEMRHMRTSASVRSWSVYTPTSCWMALLWHSNFSIWQKGFSIMIQPDFYAYLKSHQVSIYSIQDPSFLWQLPLSLPATTVLCVCVCVANQLSGPCWFDKQADRKWQLIVAGWNNVQLSSAFSPVALQIDNKEFLCITHTFEHNYISPSSTVGIQQLLVSALYVGHLQVVI